MLNLPVYVGLDYHSKTIQVCVMDKDKNKGLDLPREVLEKLYYKNALKLYLA